jgi:serine/threonine-protein kinase
MMSRAAMEEGKPAGMTTRLCPECDAQSEGAVCPKCGARTFFEAESDPGVDPLLGRVLDERYRIETRIGRGGMGTVYKAVQIAMSRVVAVKVMNPELARNSEAVKRFHREARAATAFDHPHAIRLIDFGQAATRELFMVMEFLDGRSLSKVLKDEAPFPVARAAKVAGEIAKALEAAHGVGLVHRDMKPDNVFLLDVAGDNDFVKVLDFGIAKFVAGSGDSTMTRTGLIVGTPHFMAPEQAKPGTPLTPAVDVYALGIMLYATLVGRHPYKGDTPLDALMSHVNEPVPELPAGVAVPDDLRALVPRMLAKEPGDRPTAAEVASLLERVRLLELAKALGASVPVPAERAPDRKPTVIAVRAEPVRQEPDPGQTEQFAPPEVADGPAAGSQEMAVERDEHDDDDVAALKPRRTWLWLGVGVVALVAAGALLWLRGTDSGNEAIEPPAVSEPAKARVKQPAVAVPVPKPEPPAPVASEPVPPNEPKPEPAAPVVPVVTEPKPEVASPAPETMLAPPAPSKVEGKPAVVPVPKPVPVAAPPAPSKVEGKPAPRPVPPAPKKVEGKPAPKAKNIEEVW